MDDLEELLEEITSRVGEIARMCDGEFDSEECYILCNEIRRCIGSISDALDSVESNQSKGAKYDRCHWHKLSDIQPYNNGFYYLLRLKTKRIVVGKKIKKGKYVTGFDNIDISDKVEMWANLPSLPKN